MKPRMSVACWLAALHFLAVTALAVDWRPYFTLAPNEGRALVTDCTAIIRDAGVPTLNIASDEQVIFGWGANGPIRHEAVTADNGRSFTELLGIQPPEQADGGFIYLPDGRTRFLVEEPLPDRPPNPRKSRIVSWISEDGINWTREDGVRYQPGVSDDSISSVPAVLQVADSVWRMYYVGDFYHTNGTRTAISTDWGVTWTAESIVNILRNDDVDPYAVYLTDGRVRIYYRRMQPPGGIAYTDGDGLVFDTTIIHSLVRDGAASTAFKLDPAVIRFPNGDVVCYMGITNSSNPPVMEKIIAARGNTSSIGSDDFALHSDYSLDQNFPNPFNQTTEIRYYLPQPCAVRVDVYNLIGQSIVTLTDGDQGGGHHVVVWNAAGQPSGVYVCRLHAGDTMISLKMLLLK
jgi:hypothetical protein